MATAIPPSLISLINARRGTETRRNTDVRVDVCNTGCPVEIRWTRDCKGINEDFETSYLYTHIYIYIVVLESSLLVEQSFGNPARVMTVIKAA